MKMKKGYKKGKKCGCNNPMKPSENTAALPSQDYVGGKMGYPSPSNTPQGGSSQASPA